MSRLVPELGWFVDRAVVIVQISTWLIVALNIHRFNEGILLHMNGILTMTSHEIPDSHDVVLVRVVLNFE